MVFQPKLKNIWFYLYPTKPGWHEFKLSPCGQCLNIVLKMSDESVEVTATGDKYKIKDFDDSPLELAELLVQEDFIIVEHERETWKFATGVAAFSFAEMGINGEKGFMAPG